MYNNTRVFKHTHQYNVLLWLNWTNNCWYHNVNPRASIRTQRQRILTSTLIDRFHFSRDKQPPDNESVAQQY